MRTILSPEGHALLAELSRRDALVALDFDGTLAPIVGDRAAARLRPETRGLLRALSLLHPCAVVSGRTRQDVAPRLAAIPLVAVVGNHGVEAGRGPVDRSSRPRVVEWKRTLRDALALVPGVDVEDKGCALAVHYRQAPSRSAARLIAARTASLLEGARVSVGDAVLHVTAAGAPDKGTAIEGLLRRLGARPVLYVGDDATDEAAFRSPAVTVAIRVGRTARSSAPWYLPGQGDVDALIRSLVAARVRLAGVGDRTDGFIRAVGT